MRVIGVDPGLTRCGVAVVDVHTDRRVTVITATVIRTPVDDELGSRLFALEAELDALCQLHAPESMAIERVFSQQNVKSAAATAQAAGIAALIAARRTIPTMFHTPTEVKAAVTGSGAADKRQVAHMVARIARTTVEGPADVTDAVAIAICHGWRAPLLKQAMRPVALSGRSSK